MQGILAGEAGWSPVETWLMLSLSNTQGREVLNSIPCTISDSRYKVEVHTPTLLAIAWILLLASIPWSHVWQDRIAYLLAYGDKTQRRASSISPRAKELMGRSFRSRVSDSHSQMEALIDDITGISDEDSDCGLPSRFKSPYPTPRDYAVYRPDGIEDICKLSTSVMYQDFELGSSNANTWRPIG